MPTIRDAGANWWGWLRSRIVSFQQRFLSSAMDNRQSLGGPSGGFESYDARQMRMALCWAFYENTQYNSAIHAWSRQFRSDLGLYADVRGVVNVAYRLVQFWATHLMGGSLDPDAGDGKSKSSALPILGASDPTRKALSRLWADSDWQIQKDVCSLLGACLGDVGVKVIDDPAAGLVRLAVVDPRTISHVDRDASGNLTRYVLEEWRADPREAADAGRNAPTVVYREEAELDGTDVVYRTFLDDLPYAWDGDPAGPIWREPYGFIPLVIVQHNNVGLRWGWSELQPILTKIAECDDIASVFNDAVRKCVDPVWLFAGVEDPKKTVRARSADAPGEAGGTAPERQNARRTEVPALYAGPDAKAQALLANLNLADVTAQIRAIIEVIESDFPELRADKDSAAGDASGRALRVARQRSEAKAHKVRAGYDAALVKAHKMALAIGGMRGYAGYEGFSLLSRTDDTALHRIGDRPVFSVDPLDDLEIREKFYAVAESAVRSGVPLEIYLARAGWSDPDIAEVKRLREEAQAQAIEQAKTAQAELQATNKVDLATKPRQAPVNGEAARMAVQKPGGM